MSSTSMHVGISSKVDYLGLVCNKNAHLILPLFTLFLSGNGVVCMSGNVTERIMDLPNRYAIDNVVTNSKVVNTGSRCAMLSLLCISISVISCMSLSALCTGSCFHTFGRTICQMASTII